MPVATHSVLIDNMPAASSGSIFSAARPASPLVITTRPQVPISDLELRARVQWGKQTSPHFILTYDRICFTQRQAESTLSQLEAAYNQIFHFTHESFSDRCPVYVIDQRSASLLGCTVRSHYSREEEAIYLVETSRHHADADIVRHVTHAMRAPRYNRHYATTPGWATLEEGFSIFLSERVALSTECFPLYGALPDVIAYHLALRGFAVESLWSTGNAVFSPKQLALLGAFFLYLGDTFSDDRVVAFSKSEDAITADTFYSCFGESLPELEYAWIQRLPVSLVALMQSEQEAMLLKWEQSIDGN